MGKKDIVTKKYLLDNERFADIFNYFIYNGEKMISPDMLSDDSTEELAAISTDDKDFFKQSIRDILKRCTIKKDDNNTYILLGAESQTDVHYAMPVRNMLYDALNYAEQVGITAKEHRKKGDVTGAEFLSGFKKDDKIKPIITLTVYFGTDDWDGPLSLHDMLDTDDEAVLKQIEDYKMHLIVLKDVIDSEKFSTDFREVIDFLKVSQNKKALKTLMDSRIEEFSSMEPETAQLLKQCANIEIKINEKEGKTNMCQAIDEMMEDARKEGIEEGKKEMCKALKDMVEDAREEGRQEAQRAIKKKVEDAREEGRQEAQRTIKKKVEDAREEGRQEAQRAINKKVEDAREEGRQEAQRTIKKKVEDAREEGRQEAQRTIKKKVEDAREESRLEITFKYYNGGFLTLNTALQETGLSEKEFLEMTKQYKE